LETFGTLILKNGQPFLELPIGETIKLNDSFLIEVFLDNEYHPISCDQVVDTISGVNGLSINARIKI